MILANLIDRLGEWNPQIFRELKERLTLKNIGIATLGSVITQAFVWLYFNSQLPSVEMTDGGTVIKETYSRYCLHSLAEHKFSNNGYYPSSSCLVNQLGEFDIDWHPWWLDIFVCLSWMLALGLILGAVYLLVADLVQEEKRGTLNFIRLSPQSARTVFIGKILGVPILVYLAAASIVPVHIWAGVSAGADIPLLVAWYATIGSLWFLLSSAATLYVLLGGIQAILTVSAVAWPVGSVVMMINLFATATIDRVQWLVKPEWLVRWFWLPISGSALWLYAFVTGCCLAATYWVWQALERRYLNPTATVIAKSQSYLLNLGVQAWVAGFVLSVASSAESLYRKQADLAGWATLDFIALFCLIPLLLPSKQALQDWSRYRRERVTHQGRKFWNRDLLKDLIGNDKSPALLAIAMNLAMALALWLPVILISIPAFPISYSTRFIAALCLGTSLMLIYAAIAHFGLFLNFKKRNLWIVAIVVGLMLLPLGCAFVLSPYSTPKGIAAICLLFSPFAPLGIFNLAGSTILATFAAQLLLLTGLTRQLQRKLQITGQSQTKELLASS